MDALTTMDADATTSSGLSYVCAAAVDAEMAMALFWVEMAAVKQSGSSCFCAAVADAVETTMETAVAASKSKSNLTTHHLYDKKPGAVMPPVLSVSSYI